MAKPTKPIKKIKDLPVNMSLRGVKFRDPKTKITGYWWAQWGYVGGEAGIWYKKNMESPSVFPLFLSDLQEAFELEVIE